MSQTTFTITVKMRKIDKKALTKERILCSKEDIIVCELNGKLISMKVISRDIL